MATAEGGTPIVVDKSITDGFSTVAKNGEMGLGPYKWIVNTSMAGMVAVLFAGLVVWGAHTVTNQAVEAHKATNNLYLEIAKQAEKREDRQRDDQVRIWQAISELSKTTQENTRINQKTQELLLETSVAAKSLTDEVRSIKKDRDKDKEKTP